MSMCRSSKKLPGEAAMREDVKTLNLIVEYTFQLEAYI